MANQEEHTQREDEPKEQLNQEGTQESAAQVPPEGEVTAETLKAKVVELEQAAASLKDQLLRKAAEFENYKKRIESDFATIAKFSNEELIVELLPILDDFSRSLKAGKEESASEPFYRGIELIYNKFIKVLEMQGVQEIETVGKLFDVYYHEALMQIPKEGVPPHTILEEVEKGYTLHGKVIRHAKVIVASEPPAPEPEQTKKSESKRPRDREDPAE